MATYNGEKYIIPQLYSILSQLNIEDEIIISDDGSNDKTLEILYKYGDERIKIIENKTTSGYTNNFENALIHSSGEYIFFSDQDDIWLPHKVQTILPFLKSDNFVMSDAYIVNSKLEIQQKLSDYRCYKKGYINNLWKSRYMGCTCAFTKKIKEYCLPFPKNIRGHDNWIGFISELKFNVVYIDKPLILYRRHENNTSNVGRKSTNSFWDMLAYRGRIIIETNKRFFEYK
jgi:glycosyltransferase involved in cell wall biosynthesis